MDVNEQTVGQLAGHVAEALAEQAELHVELAKAQIAREVSVVGNEAKTLAKDALPLVAAVPLIAVGYVFACVAAALALATLIGTPGGVAVVAALNLLLGIAAAWTSVSRLRSHRMFGATNAPVHETSAGGLVTALRQTQHGEVPHAR